MQAVAIVSDVNREDGDLSVPHAEAVGSYAKALSQNLRAHAASLALETVELAVPEDSSLQHGLLQAGFEPDRESRAAVWVYELGLRGAES